MTTDSTHELTGAGEHANLITGRSGVVNGCDMNVEKLRELQRKIDDGQPLSAQECSLLIGDIWKLKTALTGKTIETDYWRESCAKLNSDLVTIAEDRDRLGTEAEELKAVLGLPRCDLENRWSNCAVRQLKRSLKPIVVSRK